MTSQPRQEFVRAAISFLQNPKLVDSSLKDKLKFLRDKGLSDIEVDEALNLALVNRHQSNSGKWNFLIILGLCFGGYKLYQAYLDSKQKQCDQPQKPAEKTKLLYSIDNESQNINDNGQPTFNEILRRMSELKRLMELQRTNFSTEIQSLKTLLLGHEKFAAPPKIPEWQLKDDVKEEKNDSNSREKSEKKQKIKTKKFDNGFIEPSAVDPNLG